MLDSKDEEKRLSSEEVAFELKESKRDRLTEDRVSPAALPPVTAGAWTTAAGAAVCRSATTAAAVLLAKGAVEGMESAFLTSGGLLLFFLTETARRSRSPIKWMHCVA